MSTSNPEYSLAELMIVAAAEAFRDNGEVLATGIGLLPRLAASVAMQSFTPDLMMTDSQAWMLSEPNAVSGRQPGQAQAQESWMGFARIFDNVWGGKRHAMVGPTQIDRFGQANISALGGTHQQPKVQMLGVRGFPGNSICHANSFFVPEHSRRVFVQGECDVVCSIGYNPERLPRGYQLDDIDIRLVITDLCVMDWQGPQHQLRLRSLHPGISTEQVQENTGFEICIPDQVENTAAPTAAQLDIIRALDPANLRARQLRDNPVGDRRQVC
ncbi:MAG: ketoacid CoA transferase [Gammaproteobacteria bacterium]|uniref:CoA-transferase subunit beta n=1 Tax=Pseudomaricurvus alcaniphilus TaxID=1166482 RepID=UPI00140ACDCF|nr:ketoacid CoA transferase [Pseudomaricurvus alcaniphilus]MBR9912969.1 ketoacid CoA transferase [Gammaproteobacteria bacterium]NHN36451.1 ketoacid CoA transferase [Pseudomaricurvus alcaniphilus]